MDDDTEAVNRWLELAHRTNPLFADLPITDVGGTLAMLTAMLINQLSDDKNERKKILSRQTSFVRELMPMLDELANHNGNWRDA